MGLPFRLDLAFPSTNVKLSFSKSLTASDHAVQRIQIAHKKEKGRIGMLTAEIADPNLNLLEDLPDPAFFDIPAKLYMGTPDKPSQLTTLVFHGKVTTYDVQIGGGLTHWQLVAHDYSHEARVRALARTYRNSTSLQVAQKIAGVYGWTVDSSVGDVNLVQRTISIGIPGGGDTQFTDWDHMVRELESDGLHCFMKGKTLYVRQLPTTQYAHTFQVNDGLLKQLNFRIQHVKGAGGLGNNSTPVAFDHTGTQKAVSGKSQQEADKVKGGDGRTHRRPVGGAGSNSDAHSQDTTGTKWQNAVTSRRGRKDEGMMTCNPVPDIFLYHLVNLDGVGSKGDGLWEVTEIKHDIVPGDGGSGTEITIARGTNKQAAKQSGAPAFAYSTAG